MHNSTASLGKMGEKTLSYFSPTLHSQSLKSSATGQVIYIIDLKWERLQISTEESPVRRGGPLLVYKVRFTAIKENQLELLLDFDHHGKISFECEKLTAVTNGEIN